MKKVCDYVLDAKRALGNPHMSDRELGARLGYSSSMISDARYGRMSDPLAMALAGLLKIDAGEVLLIARAEREKEGPIRNALLAYAKKVLSSVPAKAVSAIAALGVTLGLMLSPAHDAQAFGGAGRK